MQKIGPRIVAIVPAKGTSDRIENKNLRILDGEYLFKRKLRQLLECKLVDEVYLDTESDEIAYLASDLPIKRLNRPSSLASNTTDGHELFAWECSQIDADIYIQALCTAPFVDSFTIEKALKELLNNAEMDSLVAVIRAKLYLWESGQPSYGQGKIPNSLDLPESITEAMSLYISRASGKPLERRFGKSPLLFPLNPIESIDVNFSEDLELAEVIAAGIRANENLVLGTMAPHLSSALLSDISRENGILNSALPKEIFGGGRFFGRAKTMSVDKCREGESWRGIYKALDSYKFIRPGDVIVVESKVKDFAYFGNLNAQLAMRAGAVGAIIDGVTRDRSGVSNLGFPVFARGYYCVDIKFEGTMRSMNLPITVGQTEIINGDYIFADSDGVVVIPASRWSEVRHLALKAIEKEFQVAMSVALGVEPMTIFSTLGEF
jgi:regulator of RNase E activity RraA/CMP-N-acetylneuraminic acid synthetase